MRNMLRKLSVPIILGFSILVVPAIAPTPVSAVDLEVKNCLLNAIQFRMNCDDPITAPDPSTGLEGVIVRLVQLFSAVIGIVAVIMIIYGGFRYITSGGDTGNVVGAKNTIIYAIVGLIVVALAQMIVRFVVENITSV